MWHREVPMRTVFILLLMSLLGLGFMPKVAYAAGCG